MDAYRIKKEQNLPSKDAHRKKVEIAQDEARSLVLFLQIVMVVVSF